MQLVHMGVLTCAVVALSGCGASREPGSRPAGGDTTAKTDVLKTGAKALQRDSPLDPMDVYLVGFHPMKEAPQHQMEAHHFCRQVNEDFAQCALFDGNTRQANTVRATTSSALSSKVLGYVRDLKVNPGDQVTAGQLLLVIESRDLESALLQAKAAEQEAHSAVAEAENSIEPLVDNRIETE